MPCIAAIDDVTAWGLLALALAVSGSGSGVEALAVIGWTALLVAGMVVLVRTFLGRAAAAYAEVGQLPIIWTGTIFVCVLLSAFASQRAGVAPIFGAFVMGSVMPRNAGLTTDVSRRIDDFVTITLLPLFFAVTGLRVDVTGLDDGLLWLLTLGILAIAVLGKWGGSLIASRYVGFSLRDSAVIGALLNTRGLTELIVLNIALTAGAISPKLFSMFVLMALATTFMAGPALRLLDPRHELSSPVEEEVELEAGDGIGLHTIVVAAQDDRNLGALLTIAEPLARSQPPRELIVIEALRSETLVAGRLRDMDEVARASRRLDDQRRILARNGVTARVAAFLSSDPARDYLRMASHDPVDLILIDGRRPWLGSGVPAGPVGRVLDQALCDVAVLVERAEQPLVDADHPVAVPFGGADHDWAALEIGCVIASTRETRLRLIGSAGTAETGDASRLLEQASLVLKGFTGTEVEPVLMEPGESIVAASADAGLFVVGLTEDWRQRGLGPVRAEIARTATTASSSSVADAAPAYPARPISPSRGFGGRRSGCRTDRLRNRADAARHPSTAPGRATCSRCAKAIAVGARLSGSFASACTRDGRRPSQGARDPRTVVSQRRARTACSRACRGRSRVLQGLLGSARRSDSPCFRERAQVG